MIKVIKRGGALWGFGGTSVDVRPVDLAQIVASSEPDALAYVEDDPIARAEREGKLKPGGTIIEATAGNTGIGLALIGVNRGYKVKLFVPKGFAEEKCILMRGFGAEVVRTPEAEGMAGAIRRADPGGGAQ